MPTAETLGLKLGYDPGFGNAVGVQPSLGAPPDGVQLSAKLCQLRVRGCPSSLSVPLVVKITLGVTKVTDQPVKYTSLPVPQVTLYCTSPGVLSVVVTVRPFASPINECDFAGYCLTATSMSFGSTPAIKPKSRSRCRSGMLA